MHAGVVGYAREASALAHRCHLWHHAWETLHPDVQVLFLSAQSVPHLIANPSHDQHMQIVKAKRTRNVAAAASLRRKVYTGTEIIVRYLARLQRDSKQNDGLYLYGHDAESSTEVGANSVHATCTVPNMRPASCQAHVRMSMGKWNRHCVQMNKFTSSPGLTAIRPGVCSRGNGQWLRCATFTDAWLGTRAGGRVAGVLAEPGGGPWPGGCSGGGERLPVAAHPPGRPPPHARGHCAVGPAHRCQSPSTTLLLDACARASAAPLSFADLFDAGSVCVQTACCEASEHIQQPRHCSNLLQAI